MGDLADRLTGVDASIGDAIEQAVMLKHRYRLARNNAARTLAPGPGWWADGDPPPRPGCELEVLIDGVDAFGAMCQAIRAARRSIWVTGWHLAPHFELVRGPKGESIASLLAEAAERVDVRVLVWAGAPLPLFHPTRAEVRAAVEQLVRSTRIRCEMDPREHPFHCHHEKTLVIDGEIAFVGGIDMTDLAGDRYDTSAHPARGRLGWHDVAAKLQGPVVRDVASHFALRWRALTGEPLELREPAAPAGTRTVQVTRTVAEGMYAQLPQGEFRVLESYVRAIREAQHFIYLENQFLWAPEITALLADKLRDPPGDDFRVVIMLPTRANNGQDDTLGQLAVLKDADRGERLLAVTLRALSGRREDRLYVHAKVGIFDDRWLTVGSANLNAHSLFNDTEMNVVTDDPDLVRDTRIRLWAEHLELDRAELESRGVRELIDDVWRPISADQLGRLQRDEPPTHRLLAMPGASRRSRRLLGPLRGLLDDG